MDKIENANAAFKGIYNETPKANPYLSLLRKIEEQDYKTDLLLKATFHLITQANKLLEEKKNDSIRERERTH